MGSRLIGLSIFVGFYLFIEIYSYYGLKNLFTQNKFFNLIYWAIAAVVLFGFIKVYYDFNSGAGQVRSVFSNILLGFGFSVMVAKFLFSGLLLTQDVVRILIGIGKGTASLVTNVSDKPMIPSRRNFVTGIMASAVALPFAAMLYGITRGKYQYTVEKITLKFKDLPKAFDGFTIAQISDIHSGSFDSIECVESGVEKLMEQKPDLIAFTGDLVNSNKEEINPFISTFAKLNAPFGKYSITGNHDYYGMYRSRSEEGTQDVYWEDFIRKHEDMGFQLLNNTSQQISKNGETIRLVGVENWGAGPFPKKGDLNKALEGVNDDEFTVLLSHDPTHWEQHALPNNKHIHLTMSGHTHGMQFGINIPGFKWSPVKYRYKRWMGLYEELGQYLYVNRGFGFLGWPGRVGMTPEITIFELKTA